MKHALASANPNNKNWAIYTRTSDDFDCQQFKKVSARYEISNYAAELFSLTEENWPGELNGSGTLVRFHTSRDLLNTLREGIPGPKFFKIENLVPLSAEDLGFIYSGVIKAGNATISIVALTKDGASIKKDVSAIEPGWLRYYSPNSGKTTIDLGGGNLTLTYAFGEMSKQDNKKYYRRNMSSSGLEIRINGRVLAHNLFKEVWGLEPHNMFNHFLVTIDLISDDPKTLPPTRTSKNGLRKGNPILANLYQWIRTSLPNPPKKPGDAHDERDLFEILADLLTLLPEPKTIDLEMSVYKQIKGKIPLDLYVHDSTGSVAIYEGKKDASSVKDVYQLKMYWDGCVLDGMQPTRGILVASSHPKTVEDLVSYVNAMTDIGGRKYRFETKTWLELKVQYPPP